MEKSAIQKTKDYKRFRLHLKNRKLNMNKIKRLSEAIKENNLLPYYPIVVNKDNIILDGQHRFEAAKMAEAVIYFIISDGIYDIDKVANSNSFQDHWKQGDYVNYYMRSGRKAYKELFDVMKEFDVPTPIASNLQDSSAITAQIKEGTFKFERKEEIIETLKFAREIGEQHGFEHWKSRAFLRAIWFIKNIQGFNRLRLYQKIQANRGKLIRKHEANEYILLLEELYNLNATEQLRFL